MTIQEKILFAEFMGMEKHSPSPDNIECTAFKQKDNAWAWVRHLNYDTDYNLLMEVVGKISKHIIKGKPPFNTDQFVRVEIVPNGYVTISQLRRTPIFTNVSIEGSLNKAIYKAALQFIEWYNTNKDA